MLEGEYRFTIDEEQFIAGPGGFVFIAPSPPAGGERVFREIAAAKAAGGDTPRGLGTDSGPRPTRDG